MNVVVLDHVGQAVRAKDVKIALFCIMFVQFDVHGRLDAFWRAEGVPHLDLLTIYAPLAARDLVVSKQDAHPNAVAHAMAAQAVGDFVAQNLGE